MVAPAARLLALDWGSTSLRAFLLGEGGQVLDQRSAKEGSSTMDGVAAYEAALEGIAGDWLAASPGLPVLACGMVGSKHGWREAPYRACPAGAADVAAGFVRVQAGARAIAIVPGLSCRTPGAAPDVMRGEETQVAGALALRPELAAGCTFVLPGTHSKWARVEEGRVVEFGTYMTGELYAVLGKHSVLSRLMPLGQAEPDPEAFAAGVRAAVGRGVLAHQLFAVRTLGLSGELAPEALPGYLSGLLIGHEVSGALRERRIGGYAALPLALVGEPALCALYERTLGMCGAPVAATFPNTAPAGLWLLAHAAGLLSGKE